MTPRENHRPRQGSIVLRAIRSVRSLAQISNGANSQNAEAKEKTVEPHRSTLTKRSKSMERDAQGSNRGKSKEGHARLAKDSTSSWEVGALSSPERTSLGSPRLPSSLRRVKPSNEAPRTLARRSSDNNQLTQEVHLRPSQLRHVSAPVENPTTRDVQARPILVTDQDTKANRLSILSIASTDSAAEESSKENRRFSNGSNIRWDREAMSQQAEKVRKEREERLKRRAERERELELERAARGEIVVPPRRDKKEKSVLARRRTPLSDIFDISVSSSTPDHTDSMDSSATAVPEKHSKSRDSSQSLSKEKKPIDPVVAATLAMLEQAYGYNPGQSTAPVDPPKPRKTTQSSSNRPRPVGFVATTNDCSEGEFPRFLS